MHMLVTDSFKQSVIVCAVDSPGRLVRQAYTRQSIHMHDFRHAPAAKFPRATLLLVVQQTTGSSHSSLHVWEVLVDTFREPTFGLPFLQNKVLLHLTTKNADETTAVAPRSGRLPCNSLPVSHAIVFGGMVQWHGIAAAMNYVDFSGSGWSASRETVSRPKQQRGWARLDPEKLTLDDPRP